MKKYLAFMKLRWNVTLQYRSATIAGILTQFFFGFMFICIYEAYYRSGIKTGMEWDALISYVWLQQALFYLIYFNVNDSDIYNTIETGQVAYEMVRPFSIYWFWYAKLFSQRAANTIFRAVPVILVAVMLPSMYSLKGPVSLSAFALFFITLILGFILLIAVGMLIYVLMFYTISSKGLFHVYAVIAEFFAGSYIPIPFMPEWLKNICYALPFRLSVDLPFRIYNGGISIQEGLQSIIIQIIWIILSVTFGVAMIEKVSKRLVVQGG